MAGPRRNCYNEITSVGPHAAGAQWNCYDEIAILGKWQHEISMGGSGNSKLPWCNCHCRVMRTSGTMKSLQWNCQNRATNGRGTMKFVWWNRLYWATDGCGKIKSSQMAMTEWNCHRWRMKSQLQVLYISMFIPHSAVHPKFTRKIGISTAYVPVRYNDKSWMRYADLWMTLAQLKIGRMQKNS